jgi:hypothetical protein
MKTIINSTIKLLFRSPGFWFFLLFAPIVSTLILKTEQTNLSAYEISGAEGASAIVEVEKEDEKVAYYGGKGRYVIKVYDASGSDLSEYTLKKLTESGAFLICRVKVSPMTGDALNSRIDSDVESDRMGAAMYLGEDFDAEAVTGSVKNGMRVFILSEDSRKDLFENELKMILGQIRNAAGVAGEGDVGKVLGEMSQSLPVKTVETIAGKNSPVLTNEQVDKRTMMGYAFAILTLGFVFGGVFVAQTVINEQKDMVLTRIRLTKLSEAKYFAAKLLSGGIVSLLLTFVMGICTFMIPAERLAVERPIFLLMVFCLGLIFSSLSLLMGILLGNVMSANIAAFTVWSLSSMLAGLYFPLDDTTETVKMISHIMPQKWFLNITELLMTGDSKGYIMLVCVAAAYLVVVLSLGSVGIRFKNHE